MADFPAQDLVPPLPVAAGPVSVGMFVIAPCAVGPAPTGTWLMGWSDPDCVSPTMRTWTATFEDVNGTQYPGSAPKCGATPITNAFVLAPPLL